MENMVVKGLLLHENCKSVKYMFADLMKSYQVLLYNGSCCFSSYQPDGEFRAV